jgi:hypothetical protein
MKARDVKINDSYHATVSRKKCRVTIVRKNPHGGWDGKNQETGRQIRIKSAQRLTPILTQEAALQINRQLDAKKAARKAAREQEDAKLAAQAQSVVAAIINHLTAEPPPAEAAPEQPAPEPPPAEPTAEPEPAQPAAEPLKTARPVTVTKAPRQDLSHIDWPAMAARWRAGESLGKLGEEIGCSWNRVWSELDKIGVNFATEKQPKPQPAAAEPAAAAAAAQ